MPHDAIVGGVSTSGAQLVGDTGIEEVVAELGATGKGFVARMIKSSAGRLDIPYRKSFVRDLNEDGTLPPLSQFFQKGGRGNGVAIKLYLALLWRCSGGDFSTDVSPRQFAGLLDLPDYKQAGARRVGSALGRLEDMKLVTLTRRRGDSPIIQVKHESGNGGDYTPPSGKIASGKKIKSNDPNLFGKIPHDLWECGHLQRMSAPALAMLLILLAEEASPEQPRWFSTEAFPKRYHLSPSVRSRGTRELVSRRLLLVTKELVEGGPDTFGRERVRNRYALINEATPIKRVAAKS